MLEPKAGRVHVHLSHATGLRAADNDGLSDPYVLLNLGGRQERSAVVKKTLSPRFDSKFSFEFDDVSLACRQSLGMEVWDKDSMVSDMLGAATLPLHPHKAALVAGDKVEIEVPLE